MAVQGRLEVTIKISELPQAKTIENQWKTFEVDCGGRIVSVTVKPKVWGKLEQASRDYPEWVAAIAGKIGDATDRGFILAEPNIQVFERKPKEAKTDQTAEAKASQVKPTPENVFARPKP